MNNTELIYAHTDGQQLCELADHEPRIGELRHSQQFSLPEYQRTRQNLYMRIFSSRVRLPWHYDTTIISSKLERPAPVHTTIPLRLVIVPHYIVMDFQLESVLLQKSHFMVFPGSCIITRSFQCLIRKTCKGVAPIWHWHNSPCSRWHWRNICCYCHR
jgi:hypothetical protein